MKKDILFIVSDMESGGFQKSLVSLLQCFDYTKYSVDLLVLSPNGIFMKQIPKEVNLINVNISSSFFKSFPNSFIELIKEKKYLLSLKRAMHFIISRFDKGIADIYMAKQIPKLEKQYDVAIDYNGQHILYYMVDKIKAKKKISYFHNDYKKWDYYKSADKKYYRKVDYIVTVSELCKNSLDEIFYDCKHKTRVVENISSPKFISKMSIEKLDFYDKNYINLITVARPMYSKGYDFAIEACKKLKDDGYKIKWYSIGVSNEKSKFKKMVKELGIENEFIFLGEKSNPYNYVKNADIYVQPSRFEGKSVAIDEAKIIKKPIIVTNFSTVYDQIQNNVNGIICDMNSESLYKAIKKLIGDIDLRKRFIKNLNDEYLGNESEVNKLYKLIDG